MPITTLRRGRPVAAVVGLLALLLTGCGAADGATRTTPPASSGGVDVAAVEPLAGPPPTPALPVTVTGADGSRETVADAGRIIALNGSIAEIVYSLGLGDHVVGRDVSTTFSPADRLPLVSHGHDISVEGTLSLRPTVVLGDARSGPPEAIDQLRHSGVPYVSVPEAWTLDDIAPRITAVAAALGVPDAGRALNARTEAEIMAAGNLAPAGAPPLHVAFLYLRGQAGVYLLGGKGSGADAMLAAVGAVDAGAARGLGSFTPITPEALIAAAPDALLLMTDGLTSVGGVDGLVKIPGIAQTPAGRDRHVVAVDDGLLLNFGPRTGKALHVLAQALYGDG